MRDNKEWGAENYPSSDRLPMAALRCCLVLVIRANKSNLLHKIQELDVLAGVNTVERDR
jgi:hypothetical protein